MLTEWSNDNSRVIEQAIGSQVFNAEPNVIDWNNAFLCFLESTATYLRDWGSFFEAWKTFRESISDDLDEEQRGQKRAQALTMFKDSTSQIEELAKTWGLGFMVICDLIEDEPEGQPTWNGCYCGAFYTLDAQVEKPFIGLAFKGTNPLKSEERLIDFNYQLQTATGYLDNNQVAQGWYTGLFGDFRSVGVPFEHILEATGALAKTISPTKDVRVHVTGHSLGGAYATLCYAQMLIATGPEPRTLPLVMGDKLNFGAPRVGNDNWAKWYLNLVEKGSGQSWRVIYDNDIVPKVPATSLRKDQTQFWHVDKGMQIFKDKDPVFVPSELDQKDPQPPVEFDSLDALKKDVINSTAHRE